MKKLRLIIIFLTLVTYTNAQNIQISSKEAEMAAIAWLQSRYESESQEMKVTAINYDKGDNGIVMYEVETSINRTVLLSGSRACLPILGIYQGSQLFDDNLPCGLRFMFDYYRERIDSSFTLEPKEWFYADMWSELVSGTVKSTAKHDPIAPLVTSHWRQRGTNNSESVDGYNYMIEPGENCSHCLVGCVAVAMGQVLNYWKSPVLTFSQFQQYDWCNMPDLLYTNDADYEKKRDAVAFLLKRCGEFVDMEYGCGGSSSSIGDASTALKRKFGFHEHTVRHYEKFTSSSTWKNDVVYDLSVGRPVIYGGNRKLTSGGHAFICDGYDGDNLFHFNWGWDSSYNNSSRFYTLSNPSPRSDRNYKYWQEAIFYARPSKYVDMCNANMRISDYYAVNPYVSQSGSPFFQTDIPIYEMVPKTMTTLTSASASSPAAWRTIPAGAVAEYVAHEEVILEDGFEAETGSDFEVRIEPCVKCDPEDPFYELAPQPLSSAYGDSLSVQGEELFAAVKPQEASSQPALSPNPTSGPLTMETDGEAEAIVVYDLQGRPVGGWLLENLTDRGFTIDVSALRPGPYLLAVRTPSGLHTARFLRK